MAAPAERAVHDLRAEGGVARIEPALLERVLEDDVGERAILLDAQEDAQRLVARRRDRAGSQDRAHAVTSVSRAPGPSRAPRRKASQLMAFRLSG